MNFELPPSDSEPIFYAIPLFFVFIVIELIINYRQQRHLYEAKDSVASITMGFGSLVIGAGVKIVAFTIFLVLHQFAIFDIGWAWWAWILCFFAEDFSFYWHHRLSHEIRVLWAAHVNHHSSQNLNYSTALRQSWAEILYKYLFWLWMPLLGFEPVMVFILMSTSLMYQFLQHTQLVHKLGPIEWIFNTPSHHRVHHATNNRYLDRNHAGVLIIWDRLFGTFQKEHDNEKPIYGITNNISTYNPLKIASHEFVDLWRDIKSADNFTDKLKYLFYPPGWSPNGTEKTAKHLRQLVKQHEV